MVTPELEHAFRKIWINNFQREIKVRKPKENLQNKNSKFLFSVLKAKNFLKIHIKKMVSTFCMNIIVAAPSKQFPFLDTPWRINNYSFIYRDFSVANAADPSQQALIDINRNISASVRPAADRTLTSIEESLASPSHLPHLLSVSFA